MTPQVVADFACVTGEGPLWHPELQRLFWVDVETGHMYAYDPVAGAARQVYQGEVIGGMTLQDDGQLLLFMARGAIGLWSEEAGLRLLREFTPGVEQSRFNDVIADPEGRVFAGTMCGQLFRLERDGRLELVLDQVGQPNGMGFSPDGTRFYFTDTKARRIERFHYRRSRGELTDRCTLVQVPEGEGMPDGLAVDAEGCLWSARWDGARLVRYSPEGRHLATVNLPVRHVTSLAFHDEAVYITSAGGRERPEAGEQAGALFWMPAGVAGRPEFRSQIAC